MILMIACQNVFSTSLLPTRVSHYYTIGSKLYFSPDSFVFVCVRVCMCVRDSHFWFSEISILSSPRLQLRFSELFMWQRLCFKIIFTFSLRWWIFFVGMFFFHLGFRKTFFKWIPTQSRRCTLFSYLFSVWIIQLGWDIPHSRHHLVFSVLKAKKFCNERNLFFLNQCNKTFASNTILSIQLFRLFTFQSVHISPLPLRNEQSSILIAYMV